MNNLIINTTTKDWHISTMETLGENEIIISDYDSSFIGNNESHLYIVNANNDGLIFDNNKKIIEDATDQIRINEEILVATDYKVIKAYELGQTLEELYPGETLIRQNLRDEINTLEALL